MQPTDVGRALLPPRLFSNRHLGGVHIFFCYTRSTRVGERYSMVRVCMSCSVLLRFCTPSCDSFRHGSRATLGTAQRSCTTGPLGECDLSVTTRNRVGSAPLRLGRRSAHLFSKAWQLASSEFAQTARPWSSTARAPETKQPTGSRPPMGMIRILKATDPYGRWLSCAVSPMASSGRQACAPAVRL